MSEAEAFEQAIRANPHDLATIAAYADWLAERGDPRGEFMQVQIALENEGLPTAERKKLQARETELLQAHEKEWVGNWADVVATPDGNDDHRGELNPTAGKKYEFTRGLLTTVNIGLLLVREAKAIIRPPELRFVRNLFVGKNLLRFRCRIRRKRRRGGSRPRVGGSPGKLPSPARPGPLATAPFHSSLPLGLARHRDVRRSCSVQ